METKWYRNITISILRSTMLVLHLNSIECVSTFESIFKQNSSLKITVMDSLIDCILFCVKFENIRLIQEHQHFQWWAAKSWPIYVWRLRLLIRDTGGLSYPPGPHWIAAYQKSAYVLYTVFIHKWLNSREVSVISIVRDDW